MNYYGIGISSGVSKAILWSAKSKLPSFTTERIIQVEKELQYVRCAFTNVINRYQALSQIAVARVGKAAAMIIEGHCLMLSDQEYRNKICLLISSKQMNAELAIWEITNEYAKVLNQNENTYLRARSMDFIYLSHALIEDIRQIKEPKQKTKQSKQGEPLIAMGEAFSVEDLVILYEQGVIGILDFLGEEEGHVSVIAKSLELPMVIHMDTSIRRLEGKVIRMDGTTGVVSIE